MGEPALKISNPEVASPARFYFLSLLSRALTESLCPLFGSDIMIGNLEPVKGKTSLPYWIEAVVRGDLEGRIGLSSDESSLTRSAAILYQTEKSSPLLIRTALLKIHDEIIKKMESQFEEEAFRCDLKKGSGFQENYILEADPQLFCCPVSSAHGTFKLFVSLCPSTKELQWEIEKQLEDDPKKIRVYSSQIDWLVSQVKKAEEIEKRLLQGPDMRHQLRSQLKQMKRVLHQLRTESLESLMQSAERLVFEVAKPLGKKVQINMTGSWVSVHKTLLNSIYEPILLLIRNAVEHGIENPITREKIGKKETGTISVLSSFKEGTIRFIVSDDGQGLDFGVIREKAVAKGIFTVEEANLKTNEQLAELIFEPGFSTGKGFSLRGNQGLGLDIVKKGIRQIGGEIRMVSTSLHGTSFELTLPVSDDLSPLSAEDKKAYFSKEEKKKSDLIDEFSDYLEKFGLAIQAMNNQESTASAYEAYRLAHLMKGLCGVLGWNRVSAFLYPISEVLKSISEEKIAWAEGIGQLFREIEFELKMFFRSCVEKTSFSLFSLRRIEIRLFQLLWSLPQSEEKTHFFIGKHHLSVIESIFLPLAENGSFSVRPESQVMKCLDMPFGSVVHFSGDRNGFAGLFLEESTLKEMVVPIVTGHRSTSSMKKLLGALNEFSLMMSGQLVEHCSHTMNLQPSAPFSYFSERKVSKVLGIPTYCFSCEINGFPFYLAGDFRWNQENFESSGFIPPENLKMSESYLRESLEQCFLKSAISLSPEKRDSHSHLVGTEGATSLMIPLSLTERPGIQILVFLSGDLEVENGLVFQDVLSSFPGAKADDPIFFGGKTYVGHLPLLVTPHEWSAHFGSKKIEVQVFVVSAGSDIYEK